MTAPYLELHALCYDHATWSGKYLDLVQDELEEQTKDGSSARLLSIAPTRLARH